APSNSRVWRMAPVDSNLHASTHRPQYMHLPMSMSQRLMACFFVAGSFTRSIAMHSIGQARSQRLQPVQMSICTSRKPRYRGGGISGNGGAGFVGQLVGGGC